MNVGTLIALAPLIGLAAGAARVKFSRAPLVAAAVVAAIYAAYVASAGIWASTCWDCRGTGQTRGDVFYVSAIFFGALALTTLLAVWLGARLTTLLQRLVHTWRELRDATTGQRIEPR